MFNPQYELRYRGKDPKVKSELEKRKTKSQYVFSEEAEKRSKEEQSKEKQSKKEQPKEGQLKQGQLKEKAIQPKEKLSSIQKFYNSVQERPEYNTPPKGVPVSYAYGLAPTILDTVYAEGQVLYRQLASEFGFGEKTNIEMPSLQELQTILNRIFALIKSTPNLLKEIYDTSSFAEMEFIKSVSVQVAQNHFAKMAMSALNIGPLGFTLLSLLANVGVASADSNPIIKRIAKLPALQNLKRCLNDAPYNDAPYNFVDGIPPNGTDMCATMAPFNWNWCEQFYVEQDNKTLCSSVSVSMSQGKPPANYGNWPCLGTDGMKQNLKTILEDTCLVSRISNDSQECIGAGTDSYTAFSKVDGLSKPGCLKLTDLTRECSRQPKGISFSGYMMIGVNVIGGVVIMIYAGIYFYRRRLLANDPSELQTISNNNRNINAGVSYATASASVSASSASATAAATTTTTASQPKESEATGSVIVKTKMNSV